jgi:hypothetical protein
MKSNLNGGKIISLGEAVKFTHAFQERNPEATKAYYAEKKLVESLLQQIGCAGIRIYNGYDPDSNKANLVLVGVDKNGNDMTEGIILENLKFCPPDCPKNSSLMK